jgi:hypothetical protein
MNRFYTLLFTFLVFTVINVSAQTQKDTIYTYLTKTPVVVDGSDADECWAKAEWHAIDKVWLPHTYSVMEEGDFAGKFKVAWDADYLYILVEVVDDSLSDDHVNPTDNYWNDDCVELFIDEDRSKGAHEYNNNAFAYHVSMFYDVIDGGTGTTVNLRDNLKVVMDTIAENTYLWEFAVKMFSAEFNASNPEASRVTLTANKLMGFSIAYCDNDGAADKQRENFIGSIIMDEDHKNVNYQTADYFGSMLLVDPDHSGASNHELQNDKRVKVYPNPATDKVTFTQMQNDNVILEIRSLTGSLVRTAQLSALQETIEIGDLAKGMYLFNLSDNSFSQTERIIKN